MPLLSHSMFGLWNLFCVCKEMKPEINIQRRTGSLLEIISLPDIIFLTCLWGAIFGIWSSPFTTFGILNAVSLYGTSNHPSQTQQPAGRRPARTHCYSSHLLILPHPPPPHPRPILLHFSANRRVPPSHRQKHPFFSVYFICIDGIFKDVIGTFLTFMTSI